MAAIHKPLYFIPFHVVFNVEKCMGTHCNGIFAGYPYIIYSIYIEYITITEVAYM